MAVSFGLKHLLQYRGRGRKNLGTGGGGGGKREICLRGLNLASVSPAL